MDAASKKPVTKKAVKKHKSGLKNLFGMPPISRDEVYKEIFEQAQSFKINRVKG
ncbi:hypothetical protein [Pseudoalteromonas sp. 1CM17D]|uniref:hypothetical protein n=1 Tax=Pseudoalteromonas sp. 1CM17D TaxID=2929162 RepID=UPI0020BE58A9|nr:hypothetical protein [Pseudoalteromonas sp. 1CM17D]MCK8095947.1 hypothetical protein [Pseudoalteromonas sp. 1CM17D]